MIPELQDIGAKRKVLPLGRHSCTLEEVERTFVPSGDANRIDIWDRFNVVLEAARRFAAPVAEVWIGGSFVTSEVTPHDIDVVFLFQATDLETLRDTEMGNFVVTVLSRRAKGLSRLDEKVDGYMMVVPPTEISNSEKFDYSSSRGYWDQFWSKARFEDSEDGRWLYPAAGYLEVVIDGFRA